MPKLHELLAVDQNLRSQAETTRQDLKNTFEKKRTHFMEKRVTFKSKDADTPDKVEEQLGLQTTVFRELAWVGEKIVAAVDAAHQIEVANAEARADVDIDGRVLLGSVPVTSLLQLQKRLQEIMDLVKSVPTLDPSMGFTADKDRGEDIYKARETEKPRTAKVFEYVVMVQPTDKHPAQVKELMVDKSVGMIHTQEWSGLITVSQKGDMLDRIEGLMRAVKKARSRANDRDVDVHENRIGLRIWDYVIRGRI